MTGKVWVVQDNGRNNFTQAKAFGEIVTLLPSRLQLQINSDEVVDTIYDKLLDFNDMDSLLAAGDPACIGIAVTVAAACNYGIVHMLKFDRQTNDYYRVRIDLSQVLDDVNVIDQNPMDTDFNV